jgi:chromosome segregation ATPase
MKLNPFSKKSGYYARIKAEHAEEQRKLEALQAEVVAAQADYEAKAQANADLERRNRSHNWTDAEVRLSRARDAAYHHVEELRRKVGEQERKVRDLRAIVDAPDKLEQSRAAIIDLRHRRSVLQAEREQQAKLISKLQRRIGDLEQRIAAETQSASEAMAAAEGDFALPESLTRLDAELRVARSTLATVTAKVQTLDIEIAAIPNQLREAQRSFKHFQADVEDIELKEQLPWEVLARAAASAYAVDSQFRQEDEFTITIPNSYIEAARAKLTAEMPGYTGEQ